MFRISDLRRLAATYLDPAEVEKIHQAFLFGAEAHEGQRRASGEPYIHHPVQVARMLAEMRLDHETIIAALLHDVIEDTPTAKPQIATRFGDAVAELVDGVSKLTHLSFESRAEAQAENFRKMLMAMARDLRVMLIKLADRVHNMRTLDALPLDKRRRIARETIDIYAPIADRLGLRSIRIELEDLGFRTLYPRRHRVLEAQAKNARARGKNLVRQIEKAMKRRLRQEGIGARVEGREKHLYSVYRKMRARKASFKQVLDVYGFRIIVEQPDDCYRVLGMVHSLYKPVPEKFNDYIAIPKANGYQSLHTTLFGPIGTPIDVQIRTEEMDQVAESGVAAHWMYKIGQPGANTAQLRVGEWVRDLIEMQTHAGDSFEFLESVKVDLFPKDIYVFTPAGEIKPLPRGATPIDLAYTVHTDIGNQCVSAKVDGRYVPLGTPLASGQTIEVFTEPWAQPNANWLDFVVSGKARTAIRNHLKHLRTEDAVELGENLLGGALKIQSTRLEDIPAAVVDALLAELRLESIEALYEEIGSGRRLAPMIAKHLARGGEEPSTDGEPAPSAGAPLHIRGAEGMMVDFGKCCHPIPGDSVMGFLSTGRGIVIHTTDCKNLTEFSDRPERWIDIAWEPEVDSEFPVGVRVDMADRKGALATVAAAIAEMGANIENVNIENRDGLNAALNFVIGVHDRPHLARIMRRIRGIGDVSRIARTGH